MPRMTKQIRMVLAEFLKAPDAELYGGEIVEATDMYPGTVYPILNRLEGFGWLISRREPGLGDAHYEPRPCGRPSRRYYSLTSEGWTIARQEAALERSRA